MFMFMFMCVHALHAGSCMCMNCMCHDLVKTTGNRHVEADHTPQGRLGHAQPIDNAQDSTHASSPTRAGFVPRARQRGCVSVRRLVTSPSA